MNIGMLSRISAVLLCVFFLAGTLGASYHACDMTLPAQAEAMAGMDCHQAAAAETKAPQKNCCVDLSCPKCFGSPLASTRFSFVAYQTALATAPFMATHTLLSRNPGTPERPPKIG